MPVPNGPLATDDLYQIFDTSNELTGNILQNDQPGANGGLFLRFFDGVAVKANPNLETQIAGDYGTFFVKADGSFRYVLDHSNPAVQSLAKNDTLVEKVSYKETDGGGRADVGILKLVIEGEANNQRPTAFNDSFDFSGGIGDSITGNVLDNDTDPDGDQLVVNWIDSPSTPPGAVHFIAGQSASVQGQYGQLDIERDGSFTYTLETAPPTGADEVFLYKTNDGSATNSSDQGRLVIHLDDFLA